MRIEAPILHEAQKTIVRNRRQFNVIRCGRRFGKNVLMTWLLIKGIKKHKEVSVISMDYPNLERYWSQIKNVFKEVTLKKSEQPPYIECVNGYKIKFYSGKAIDTMRGDRNDWIYWDEAAHDKNLETNWQSVVLPTLIDNGGGADFCSTPKGHNYFKDLDNKSLESDNWASFHFTSYDNPHLQRRAIDEIAYEMPEVMRRQEIYAEYVDLSGGLIKRQWVKYINEPIIGDVVVGVDLAISSKDTADYTAMVVLSKHDDKYYILDVYRGRLTFRETCQQIENLSKKWSARRVGIEEVAYQSALIQELKRNTDLDVIGIRPERDKLTRAMPLIAKYELGLIYHTPNAKALEDELLAFPQSEHDDQVDALVYAYYTINRGGRLAWVI